MKHDRIKMNRNKPHKNKTHSPIVLRNQKQHISELSEQQKSKSIFIYGRKKKKMKQQKKKIKLLASYIFLSVPTFADFSSINFKIIFRSVLLQ